MVAIADHQVAHVYVQDAALKRQVEEFLRTVPGIAEVLDEPGKWEAGVDHPRSGDLVAVSDEASWFSYYFWDDDRRAPDYARTVDIHRKPGYDPVELFLDPAIRFPQLKIGGKLAGKKLGMRTLLDVIPLDASLVRGSHGALAADPADWPVLAGRIPGLEEGAELPADEVFGQLAAAFEGGPG